MQTGDNYLITSVALEPVGMLDVVCLVVADEPLPDFIVDQHEQAVRNTRQEEVREDQIAGAENVVDRKNVRQGKTEREL